MFDFNTCIDDIGRAVLAGDRKEAARLGEELYNWVEEHASNPYLRESARRAWSYPMASVQMFALWPGVRWGENEDFWLGAMTPRHQEDLRKAIVKALTVEEACTPRLTPVEGICRHSLESMFESLAASGFVKAV